MIVLHAAFCEDSLLLWAESSLDERPKTRVRRNDAPAAPFDAGPSALLAAAAEVGIPLASTKRPTQEVIAWLPSHPKGPISSTTLSDDLPAALAPWVVTALALDLQQAIPLLAACAGKKVLRPGLIAGSDVAYWVAALQFAAGLVMRGQFLPGLREDDQRWRAIWQPVIAGSDNAKLQALAQAMPPAARAVRLKASDAPPEAAPQLIVGQFLEFAVSALVRSDHRPATATVFDSIHDRWMSALQAGDGAIKATANELSLLLSQIESWQRPIQLSAKAPFRLCFRLEEPPEDTDPWLLRFLLQGNRDPSLLIPVVEALRRNKRSSVALGDDAAATREYLLISLGQAAAIYPAIEASLEERAPDYLTLDASGAHRFLSETAAALEQSGFGVMLPAWWTRKGSQSKLLVRAHVKSPKMTGHAGLSLESLVQFDWQLALGDAAISSSELTALAKLKAPLVKIRGQWVEVDADQIKAALNFLNSNSSGTATVGEVVRMSLGVQETPAQLEVGQVTATGWVADLLSHLEGSRSFEELPPPVELRAILRPYQKIGYSWMHYLKQWGLGACLADDMGLGKTVQALALLLRARTENSGRPVLLVCPTSVVGNWQKEAQRFAPDLAVLVHHGITRNKGEAFKAEAARHAVVLSSYSLLHRDADILSDVPWSGVILDEAQNIKNPETKQARAARSLKTGWRMALTGTPVENNVGDLWSLMEFLNPGFLGSESSFKKRFFVPIQVYGDQDAAARLRRVTGPFILRRLKTDKSIIIDLPEKLEMKVFCTLTKEQASLYSAIVKNAESAIDASAGIERKGLVLATLTKLKQVCNHPAHFLKDHSEISGRSGKLSRLTEMLEETLEAGDRSLIFTQFTEMGHLMRRHLQETFGVEVLYLHGATPKGQRDHMVERFGGPNGPPIFLLSLKAGGTGLNLTAANHVFHFDRWWNPAVENQATDRAFRIGQTRNVQVHKFVCAGTLEEKIDEMIERKKDVAGQVMGTGEGWLTELSNAELKNLFALRKEAVGE